MTNPAYVGATPSAGNALSVSRTPAAGNDLILQIVAFNSSGDTPTVTDSTGATVIADFAFASGIGVYRVHNAAGVSHTLNVSWSTAPSNWYLTLNEAQNVGGVDTAAGTVAIASGTSATPTTGSLDPPASGDLLFAAIAINHFLSSLGSLTNGFTQTEVNISGPSYIEAYLSQPSAGSVNCGATANISEAWSALLIAYKGTITLSISPSTLANGTAETPYSETISASGGTAPYIFAVTAGTLPPGLILASGGVLSGTPTTAGTYSFTIQATDAVGDTGSQAYSGVTIAAPTITVSPTTTPGGIVGVAYSQAFSAAGGIGPYTFSVSAGTLPPGLTLSIAGLLHGTPTAAGSSSFSIEATDADGYTGTQPFSGVTITAPTITISPSSLLGARVNAPFDVALSASGGTGPYTFAVTSGSLPPGLSLTSAGVLSGAATAGGGFTFAVEATDFFGDTGTQTYGPFMVMAGPTDSAATSGPPPNLQTLPIQPLASQTFEATLGGQACTITLQQLSTGLFFTIAVAGVVIVSQRYCADRVSLVRPAYLGFVGYLYFVDTSGDGDDPSYEGLGSQFLLVYEND